jgi:predicted dinucleotide-binding enzyme
MRIAVLGSGVVGRTLALGLAERGHDVKVGTRDPAATLARGTDTGDGEALPPWHGAAPVVELATFRDAARSADVIVNATNGVASIEVLTDAGAENLAGKVLLDVTNPLDFSAGFPPTLFVSDSDSLAEQIQRAFPEARVVKSLNTMTSALMVDPELVQGGDFTTFVSGNDASAKKSVVELLGELGHRDVIDLGDLTTARGAEMILPLWLRLMGALETPTFGFKVVRGARR